MIHHIRRLELYRAYTRSNNLQSYNHAIELGRGVALGAVGRGADWPMSSWRRLGRIRVETEAPIGPCAGC
jgi:hypothetical protein